MARLPFVWRFAVESHSERSDFAQQARYGEVSPDIMRLVNSVITFWILRSPRRPQNDSSDFEYGICRSAVLFRTERWRGKMNHGGRKKSAECGLFSAERICGLSRTLWSDALHRMRAVGGRGNAVGQATGRIWTVQRSHEHSGVRIELETGHGIIQKIRRVDEPSICRFQRDAGRSGSGTVPSPDTATGLPVDAWMV